MSWVKGWLGLGETGNDMKRLSKSSDLKGLREWVTSRGNQVDLDWIVDWEDIGIDWDSQGMRGY